MKIISQVHPFHLTIKLNNRLYFTALVEKLSLQNYLLVENVVWNTQAKALGHYETLIKTCFISNEINNDTTCILNRKNYSSIYMYNSSYQLLWNWTWLPVRILKSLQIEWSNTKACPITTMNTYFYYIICITFNSVTLVQCFTR